ncbi:MAG: TetR/AcrR family transcriptional regulator [Kofleriaceae bacterium]|nr:TetR/AcrR family transcriptional regulator [Kofleriaceae bacterium]MCL4228459.1 TetR/AcrR family transcriptional regulator [Myxococcales bacterium]
MIHEQVRSPRARRHDANLGRILDAATQVVAEGGLEALSMSKLAAAVDYTPGALYRYVESKDALLARLVERILADVRADLVAAQAALSARTGALARVGALVRTYRDFARREPHRFGLLAVTMADPRVLLADPAHAGTAAAAVIAALEPLAAVLTAAAAAGQLAPGDAVERTLCLFTMLHGVLQLPKLARNAPQHLDIDRLALAGTRALLVGWGASPRHVARALEELP